MLCVATHLLKSTWAVSSFCYLRESCCGHSCTVFNVNINLLFSGISAQENSGWSIWKSHVLQETVISLLSTYLCHCIWVESPMTDYCWITLFYHFNLVCKLSLFIVVFRPFTLNVIVDLSAASLAFSCFFCRSFLTFLWATWTLSGVHLDLFTVPFSGSLYTALSLSITTCIRTLSQPTAINILPLGVKY